MSANIETEGIYTGRAKAISKGRHPIRKSMAIFTSWLAWTTIQIGLYLEIKLLSYSEKTRMLPD